MNALASVEFLAVLTFWTDFFFALICSRENALYDQFDLKSLKDETGNLAVRMRKEGFSIALRENVNGKKYHVIIIINQKNKNASEIM